MTSNQEGSAIKKRSTATLLSLLNEDGQSILRVSNLDVLLVRVHVALNFGNSAVVAVTEIFDI